MRQQGTPWRVLVGSITALALGPWACSDNELQCASGASHCDPGSTLPVPDMTKVSFTSGGALSRDLVVMGEDDAIPRAALAELHLTPLDVRVVVSNVTTGASAVTTPSETGSFVGYLADTARTDEIIVALRTEEQQSDSVALETAPTGGAGPPAPHEIDAIEFPINPGRLEIQGLFVGFDPEILDVRVTNRTRRESSVFVGAAIAEGEVRRFALEGDAVAGSVEDELLVNGIIPGTGEPGPFTRVFAREP